MQLAPVICLLVALLCGFWLVHEGAPFSSLFLVFNAATFNKPCESPFGTIQGTVRFGDTTIDRRAIDVQVVSNCNSDTTSNVDAFLDWGQVQDEERVYTGMQWQCVEFARRFLLLRKNFVFGSVDGAEDIFSVCEEVWDPLNASNRRSFLSIAQGSRAVVSPFLEEGVLIIWSRQLPDMPFGHVAVVVNVDVGQRLVHIAEQNYNSEVWSDGQRYSRSLPLSSNGFFVDDAVDTIVGYKKIH